MGRQTTDNKRITVANNKQNQLPENLSLDKKVDGWAVWFCLSSLATMHKTKMTKTDKHTLEKKINIFITI